MMARIAYGRKKRWKSAYKICFYAILDNEDIWLVLCFIPDFRCEGTISSNENI